MTIWLTILGMALVTYLTRATMLVALRNDLAPWLRRWLDFVPVAVFTALIIPALIVRTSAGISSLVLGPALPAGIVGCLVAWYTRNVLATIAAGMVIFWVLNFSF